MESLLFRTWLLSEMANFGFADDSREKIMGGTEVMVGDEVFKPVDSEAVIEELNRFNLGSLIPKQLFSDTVQWGDQVGAIRVDISPQGSMRLVARRKVKDLQGEDTWICKFVQPISDVKHERKELGLAQDFFKKINEINQEMIEGPDREFLDLERLAWKMWAAVKREHPSYIMFPITLRKQDENYFKLVFEYRGQGVEKQKTGRAGRAEQFDIDLFWDSKKGLIRCWGYSIDSLMRQHTWEVQPSDWDEWFSPHQQPEQIIESIVKIFLQY